MILVSQTGQNYSLQLGDNIIGRGADCQVRLEHERVSRRHAVIHWDGSQARIMDLGSTNGTSLNGRRLEPQHASPLAVGHRLEIGGEEVLLEVAPDAPPAVSTGAALIGAPAPAPRPARPLPIWLIVLGGVLLLLLIFALAVLWSANRAQPASTPAEATPLVQLAPETPAPASAATRPTATLGVPAVEGVQQPSVNIGGGAAAPAAAMQLPPVNPTTLPSLITAASGGTLPGDLSTLLGGTPIPGLPIGTPGIALPAGVKRHNPPRLLNPASGSSYQGEDALIILEWAPVEGLAANEYYWVMVFYPQNGKEQAGGTWIKATSYRVPAWFLTQASGRFEWQVVIAEATGPVERGGRLGARVSDPSERWWFMWGPGGGSAPPPPSPVPPAAPTPSPVPPAAPTPTYGG